jgi:predicted Zn-dependent protease
MLQASNGAGSAPDLEHRRHLDIDLRVGDYQLDNTHTIIDGSYFDEPTHFDYQFPISNDQKSMTDALYIGLDDAYRASLRRLIKIESNSSLKVEREDQSDDFSKVEPITHLEESSEFDVRVDEWQPLLNQCSEIFTAEDTIFDSMVSLNSKQQIRWFLSTDGTQVREVSEHYRLSVMSRTVADDGMKLMSYEYLDLHSAEDINLEQNCRALVEQSIEKIIALRSAPLIDPYVAPAILHGRAAAVFFHEILGHRVEGSRLKDEDDGQTLSDKVGEQIFPEFIQITDDPTIERYADEDLNGHYRIDDEGVPAQKVEVVKDGVLEQFLMSRSPIEGFSSSNGHGRREMGLAPVARQGNLFISSSKSVSYPELKKLLIKEINVQNKEFGLIFDDISGGFTFTGRTTPNSYVVKPVTVWKVYPDGREEMVRGVDMIGTPLLTFSRIMATSDRELVFNGACGAESGWVPVSAIAPDILVREVEVQRRQKSNDRPPILSKPTEVTQ